MHSTRACLPFQSINSAFLSSLGRIVDASIINEIPFKAGGIVSGKLKSPKTNSAPQVFKKFARRKFRVKQRTW
jgi:hypothetical protein